MICEVHLCGTAPAPRNSPAVKRQESSPCDPLAMRVLTRTELRKTDESLTVLRRCHVRVLSYAPSTPPIQAKCPCSGEQQPLPGKHRPFLLSTSTHGSALVPCVAIVERPYAQLGLLSEPTRHSRASARCALSRLALYSNPSIKRYELCLIARHCILMTTASFMLVLACFCLWMNTASSSARTSYEHQPAASNKFE